MSNIKKVEIPLHVGDTAEFTKTVTETDVYLFGGITADYSQMHFNEENNVWNKNCTWYFNICDRMYSINKDSGAGKISSSKCILWI